MRMHIWLAMIVGAAAIVCGRGGEVNAQNGGVRALKFASPKPPMTIYTFAGKNEMTTFADAEAVEKLLGAETAKGLVDQVDFGREKMVLVSWSTSGPPVGVLKYEVKKDGTIVFYMQGPGMVLRGDRRAFGADFFAVPRDAEVVFDTKEQ